MVQPYLGQPNYVNAMQSGLGSRLAYDQAALRRGARSVGRLSGIGSATGPTLAAEREAEKNMMLAQEAKRAEIEKTKSETWAIDAGREKTKAETKGVDKMTEMAGKPKELNEMEKEQLRQTKYAQIEKGLQTAVNFVPQLTRRNYGDWKSWVEESDFVPSSMFKSDVDVLNMNDVEFNQYKSVLETLKTPDPKLVKAAYDVHSKEVAERTKIAAAEKTAAAKVEANKKATAARFVTDMLKKYDTEDAIPLEIMPQYEAAKQIMGGQLTNNAPAPTGAPKILDANTARSLLEQAGGDKVKARQMAIDAGYTL